MRHHGDTWVACICRELSQISSSRLPVKVPTVAAAAGRPMIPGDSRSKTTYPRESREDTLPVARRGANSLTGQGIGPVDCEEPFVDTGLEASRERRPCRTVPRECICAATRHGRGGGVPQRRNRARRWSAAREMSKIQPA